MTINDMDKLIHFIGGEDNHTISWLMRQGGYSYYDAINLTDVITTSLIKMKPRKAIVECPCCGSHVERNWPVCRKCGQALDWSEVEE